MNSQKTMVIFLTTITLISSSINSNANAQTDSLDDGYPYETVNNFCLSKKLHVERAFCLRILKSPYAANAEPDDFMPLLNVAINATSIFVCKTISRLQDLLQDKNTRPSFSPVIEECISAYESTAAYITNVITDAAQESAILGLDGEVIEDNIKFCVRALGNSKNRVIRYSNREAKNHAKLLIDIAGYLGNTNKTQQ